MTEHMPIELDQEIDRVSDLIYNASAAIVEEEMTSGEIIADARNLSTETLKKIADVLAEVAVRSEDLSDSIIETVRERSRVRLVAAFANHVIEIPVRKPPYHNRLGSPARWYWCGIPDCPDCRARGVLPAEVDA